MILGIQSSNRSYLIVGLLIMLALLFFHALFHTVFIYAFLEPIYQDNIVIEKHNKPVDMTSPYFISVGLDSSLIYDGLEKLNLDSPKLIELTSKLAPGYLRVGGTMADRLIFAENPQNSSEYVDKFLPFFTMSESDIFRLKDFCTKTGLKLLFDLNVLLRNGNAWNPSNAIKIMKAFKKHKIPVVWQLGNEPNSFQHVFNTSVSPQQLAQDYGTLKKFVSKFSSSRLIVGPDTTRPQPNRPECVEYMREFLKSGHENINAIAWHQYYLNGRTSTLDDFWDPNVMNLLQTQIETMLDNIQPFQGNLQMWLTETSSAYGGGAPNLSNSYSAIPLWLDKLGVASKNGIKIVTRQSLLGGNYSLLDENHNPLPDYWISALYKRIVGPVVVQCSLHLSEKQRFYCHCSKEDKNRLVIYGMNLDNSTVTIRLGGSALLDITRIDEYMFTAPANNLLSKNILLNEKILRYVDSFPNFTPNIKNKNEKLVMPPHSFVFWYLYNVDIPHCIHDLTALLKLAKLYA